MHMNKLVIIDDDYLVRLNIKTMIDWHKHDIEIVGEAKNGDEGWQLINKVLPDVILLDVQMPKADGIDLSKKISEMDQPPFFIMLSNYNDFDYVRSTMKNGAYDYILKHELNEHDLLLMINKGLSKKNKKANNLLKFESFMAEQLYEGNKNLDEFKSYHSKLNHHWMLPVVIIIDGYELYEDHQGRGELIKRNLLIQMKEIISDQDVVINGKGGKYNIVFSIKDCRSQKKLFDYVIEQVLKIKRQAETYFSVTLSVGIGDVTSFKGLCQSYIKAKRRLAQGFYKGLNALEYETYPWQQNIHPFDKHVLSLSEAQLFDDFIKANEGIEPNAMMAMLKEMTETLDKKQHEQVFKCLNMTYPNLMLIKEAILKSMTLAEKQYSETINHVIKKVHDDLDCGISLNEIAMALDMNPSYLSTLFKEEVGCKFSDYLTGVRMDKATYMMGKGERNLKLIAELCGYLSYSHFSSAFKKYHGLTPKNYIKQRI